MEVDANDDLDAQSWVRFWQTGGTANNGTSSQRSARARRYEESILDRLVEGDVDGAMTRLDRLIELAQDHEAVLDMIGIGPLQSIRHRDLDSEPVVRQLRSRACSKAWAVALTSAASAWPEGRLS